ISRKAMVLAIGDKEEISTTQKNDDRLNFKEDFMQHLALLLLDTHDPVEVIDDWTQIERFGMASVKEDNKPRQYHFYRVGDHTNHDRRELISGPTLHSRLVLDEVKKRLSGENWIADNIIETPFRAKEAKEYYNLDMYMQHQVSEALDAPGTQLFKYVLHLHREYVRN
ncbi:hypothetical protein KR222_011727, partial [Zaprionus bogoriensis]